MGFLDRFTAKKPTPEASATSEASGDSGAGAAANSVKARLVAAREKLEAKDLAGAIAIYEELLASAGDRADVLVTVSGDLGAHGHVTEIIELVAPRYDAERHGPATGLNLLQAYLAVRQPDAAQHVLDILFGLNRPELEDRLHGFSNAIAEMLAAPHQSAVEPGDPAGASTAAKVGLITVSKPVWFYGLESLVAQVLPPKEGRLRRIAFAQLALPGYPEIEKALDQPEDELNRLSRALPLWFAETFYFAANYAPIAAIGIITPPSSSTRLMIFGAEWTTDNLRQLVDTTEGGLDYIVTGSLRAAAGDYELTLRLFEVKNFRERKKFTARWTPATADVELAKVHAEVRRFMEWSPASAMLAYAPPAAPRAWLETLGASLGSFVADKAILAPELLPPLNKDLAHAAQQAATGEAAALAFLTLRARATKLGQAAAPLPALARSTLVQQAQQLLG